MLCSRVSPPQNCSKQCSFTKSVTKGKLFFNGEIQNVNSTFVRLGYLIAVNIHLVFSSCAVDFSAKAILVSLKIDIYNYLTPNLMIVMELLKYKFHDFYRSNN